MQNRDRAIPVTETLFTDVHAVLNIKFCQVGDISSAEKN